MACSVLCYLNRPDCLTYSFLPCWGKKRKLEDVADDDAKRWKETPHHKPKKRQNDDQSGRRSDFLYAS